MPQIFNYGWNVTNVNSVEQGFQLRPCQFQPYPWPRYICAMMLLFLCSVVVISVVILQASPLPSIHHHHHHHSHYWLDIVALLQCQWAFSPALLLLKCLILVISDIYFWCWLEPGSSWLLCVHLRNVKRWVGSSSLQIASPTLTRLVNSHWYALCLSLPATNGTPRHVEVSGQSDLAIC